VWKKIGPLLIILSVSLNIAFVGAWVVQAAKENSIDPAHYDQVGAGVSCPLHRDLEVTDEQWGKLEPRLTKFRSESEAICQDIQRMRGELIDLIATRQPDSEAIAAKQEEILTSQRKMQEHVIAHLLAEKQTLSEEQQAKLFEMIREKTGCAGRNTMVCPVSIPGVQSRLQSDVKTEP